jgi:hypothetical protein
MSGQPCPFVCSGGFCSGSCVPGSRQCGASGLPQTCNSSGAWVDGQPCPFVCSGAGVCSGQCVPGTMRCVGGQNQTCSTNGLWQSAGTATIQLFGNPNFDTTAASWLIGQGYPEIAPIAAGAGITAHTPPNVAWEGGYAYATDDMYQPVTIPGGATSIVLSFYALVSSPEVRPYAYDYLEAYVSDAGGVYPTTLVTLDDLTDTPTWTRFTSQIPLTYAGGNIEIGFYTTTDDVYDTTFLIDSTALTVTACAP